jgi:hypothetical protein
MTGERWKISMLRTLVSECNSIVMTTRPPSHMTNVTRRQVSHADKCHTQSAVTVEYESQSHYRTGQR